MNQNYAGFWIRFVAWLIDALVVGVLNGFIGLLLRPFLGQYIFTVYAFSLVITIGYWVFYQAWSGQTLGKKAMNLKVVTLNDSKPTPMTFFLREIIGKFISGAILGIGYLMIIWDNRKQGLHDKIASTYVVKIKS